MIFKNTEEHLCIFIISAMVLLNFSNILSRYILRVSLSGAEEVMLYLFVWLVFLAASVGAKKGKHLRFVLFLNTAKTRTKRYLSFIIMTLSCLFLLILLISGTRMVISEVLYSQTTPELGLPEYLGGLAVPLGSLLIIYRLIERFIENGEI